MGIFRNETAKDAHEADGAGGFTLLEVIVALAILSGLVITLIVTLNFHIGFVERNKALTTATLLAREKLEELRLGEVSESAKGDFAARFEGFTWKYDTGGGDGGETGLVGLKKVSLTVFWGEGERLTLVAYEALKP